MDFTNFSLNEWITILVIIAQAGIVYYRLKKVEQTTERFNDLFIEFAVHKNTLKNHRDEFEKQTVRIENIIEKLDRRVSGVETKTYQIFLKDTQVKK